MSDVVFDEDFHPRSDSAHHRERRGAMTGRGNSLDTCACDTVIPLPDDIRAEFPLDPFYQKYTHAYGIPIISSDNTGDAAVIRACYTVRFLLADRKDIRDSMFDQYGRVGVIAKSERTTEIPEHSHLNSDFIDDRARGLGGVPSNPITTNAEENLVCGTLFEDRWFEEDVLVHEFAHSINLISLNRISSTFQTDLLNAYNMAKTSNLWQDTYAISKVTEYFAEGVQAFFNVQVCRGFTDYIHNHICTRDALKSYDPQLYDIIADVFPCKNVLVDRCETDQGMYKYSLTIFIKTCSVWVLSNTAESCLSLIGVLGGPVFLKDARSIHFYTTQLPKESTRVQVPMKSDPYFESCQATHKCVKLKQNRGQDRIWGTNFQVSMTLERVRHPGKVNGSRPVFPLAFRVKTCFHYLMLLQPER